MKRNRNTRYLVLIPAFASLFWIMQNSLALSDVTSGTVTGVGAGLSILAILVIKKGDRESINIKKNIQRKILRN